MPLVHEDGRVGRSAVSRVLQNVLGARVPRGMENAYGATYQLVCFVELAEMRFWYIGEPHDVVAV
eukprot:1380730-Pleurochrysis_carterae.AAC.1